MFIFGQPKTNQKAALYKLLVSFALLLKKGRKVFSPLSFFSSKTSAQFNKGKGGIKALYSSAVKKKSCDELL